MKLATLSLITLLTAGCMNITASVQPENTSVPELRESSDCAPIIFGLAYGSASVDVALKTKVQTLAGYDAPWQPIVNVRRVQLHDYQFLFFGARCVEVVGE